MMLMCLMVSVTAALAQTKVTGIVVEDGTEEPIIGASVMITGTKKGVVTDIKGNY